MEENDLKNLDRYLKNIAGENKAERLVDRGSGSELKVNPEVLEGESGKLLILKREKKKVENNTDQLHIISGNLNGIYPGAIVHADSNLVDGRPNIVAGAELKRKPLLVGLDIYGNTLEPVKIEQPNQHSVMAVINKMVEEWCKSNHQNAVQMEYKMVTAYDKNQLDVKLGIKGAGEKFKIDFGAIKKGIKQEMLVFFTQIYYTARVEPQTASQLYADSVTPQDLEDNGVNADNPLAALVTSMDFGRQIVIKLSTENTSDMVKAAWECAITGNRIENKNKYMHIMNNTNIYMFVLGGKAESADKFKGELIDFDYFNRIVNNDMKFDKNSAAYPISYATNFIDDGSQAVISRSTEYVQTSVTERGRIHVKTDTANAYVTKHQKLFGRKITGINEDGTFKLGNWECILDAANGNKELDISGSYAEFGFEFDIVWGTDWPYSGVFWTADKEAVNDIFIDMSGTCRNAGIEIKVNGKRVFYDSDCSSHRSYFGS